MIVSENNYQYILMKVLCSMQQYILIVVISGSSPLS